MRRVSQRTLLDACWGNFQDPSALKNGSSVLRLLFCREISLMNLAHSRLEHTSQIFGSEWATNFDVRTWVLVCHGESAYLPELSAQ